MSKPKSNTATPRHFEAEVLEPRILFSADGLSPVDTDIDPVETVVIETISAEESPTDPNAQDSLFDTADDIQIEVATPAEEPTREPAEPAPAAADFTPSTPLPEPQATAPESISDRPAPVTQNTAADQSAASLNTANGPPQLAGSEAQTSNYPADAPAPQAGSPAALFPHIPALTAPDASPESIAGQVFYLNFTGTTDLNLLDTTLSIPAFEHPGVIPEILASLALTYANSGVTFTADQPATGDYSTIHIGGTDHAFAAHGAFHGLAEKIDPGNTDHNDTALVFAETVLRDNLSHDALTAVIA
ncbi:MAG: LEPR-XLL domain-containing protein [Verrucomicrobiales bacterium]|nr:LEPR-XLL domain-containing protein [Verrucomicrobiales bacterium]